MTVTIHDSLFVGELYLKYVYFRYVLHYDMHHFLFLSGVGAATSGKLTFMVGGLEEEFNAAKELLSCMGANVVYCGQVGTGQV